MKYRLSIHSLIEIILYYYFLSKISVYYLPYYLLIECSNIGYPAGLLWPCNLTNNFIYFANKRQMNQFKIKAWMCSIVIIRYIQYCLYFYDWWTHVYMYNRLRSIPPYTDRCMNQACYCTRREDRIHVCHSNTRPPRIEMLPTLF